MINRFQSKQKRDFSRLKDILLPVLFFLLIVVVFYYAFGDIGATTKEEQLRSVERAVMRATVQCYAIEGQYPPDLEYLENNYGLRLDWDRYIIQYDAFASNIMPTVLVLPLDFDITGTAGEGGMDNAF